MIVQPFKGPGSTPSRRRFWDQVAAAVSGSTKQAGRHVTVSEHHGKGTFINVADTSTRRGGVTVGCASTITVEFSGLAFPCCVFDLGTGSISITGINLNDRVLTLNNEPAFPCEPGQCFWDVFDQHVDPPDAEVRFYSDESCTAEYHASPEGTNIVVGFLGGIYYIYVWIPNSLGFAAYPGSLFYAESASIASPISNSFVSCSAALGDQTIDNAFSDCWNGEPIVVSRFAYGGTVQITI